MMEPAGKKVKASEEARNRALDRDSSRTGAHLGRLVTMVRAKRKKKATRLMWTSHSSCCD